jgi:hypothetical protein
MIVCAIDLPCLLAIAPMVASFSSRPDPSGLQLSIRMPRLAWDSRRSRSWKRGCS